MVFLRSQRAWVFVAAVPILVCSFSSAGMGAAATGPSAVGESAGATAETPIGMLKASDALNGAGPEAFAQFYQASNDDQRRMARIEARFDSEFGLLQLLVEKKWGPSAGDAITHAFGGQTTADAEAGDLSVHGDHATLTWKDNAAPPLQMVRVGGKWKVDLEGMLAELNVTPEQYNKGFFAMAKAVADFAEAVDHGQLRTLDAAVADAKQRVRALSTEGD